MGDHRKISVEVEYKFRSCLIFFGLLVLLAVITSASEEENEIQELSERVVREAEADPRRRRKKGKKGKGKKRNGSKVTKKRKGGKKKSQVKKNQRSGKKRKRDRKKKTTRCGRQADGKCLENAVTAMNRWLWLTRKRAKKDCLVQFPTSWCLQEEETSLH